MRAAIRKVQASASSHPPPSEKPLIAAPLTTGDAVLVANRDHAQNVKQVVSQLTDLEDEAATYHTTVHRPWGSYTVLEAEHAGIQHPQSHWPPTTCVKIWGMRPA